MCFKFIFPFSNSYNFFKIEPATNFKGNFNAYFEYWMWGMLPFSSWFEYYSEWWRYYKYKNTHNNILWIYYEDLQQNAVSEIEKIAKFIGKYDSLAATEMERQKKIRLIAERSSFKNMKQLTNDKVVDIGVGTRFFRKGIVNDWKNWMTKRQSDIVDHMIRCKFYETDFKYYQQLKQQSDEPHLPLKPKL